MADEFFELVPETTRSPFFDFTPKLNREIETIKAPSLEQNKARGNFNGPREKILFEALSKIETLARASINKVESKDSYLLFGTTNNGLARNIEIIDDMLDKIKKITGLE